MSVCPVCNKEISVNKSYCTFCGWGMTEDLSLYGSLFSEEQSKEYQERISLYRKFVNRDAGREGLEFETLQSTQEYFESHRKEKSEIRMVDMAFHAGAEWFSTIEKNDILYELADQGVKFRVLLNTPEQSELIGRHMRHQRKSYMTFEECIRNWKKFEEQYAGQVEVRVIDIPILHRYYSFYMKDFQLDTVNIKYYAYANVKPGNNYQSVFAQGSSFLELYREEFAYLWDSKPVPDSELCEKNRLAAGQMQEKMIYVKAPNRDLETIYELKQNGDVVRYEITGGSVVFRKCKAITMVYAQTPFAACVRENGQVVCAGGIEDMIQGELESVNFKVKDIASNYFGTFLLNEAGGVVGINNFPIRGLDSQDSGFKMGYFKGLPKSGICKIMARDAELLMMHIDGSVRSYSMKDCGFFPRGYRLNNLEEIKNIDWSSAELLDGGFFGEEWVICEMEQPNRILAASSERVSEVVNEIIAGNTKETILQLQLTEDSVLAVRKPGEIVQKRLAIYPNPGYSVWLNANPETKSYKYQDVEDEIRKVYYHNQCLFVETNEAIYVPGGVWGPRRFANVLKPKATGGSVPRRRKKQT